MQDLLIKSKIRNYKVKFANSFNFIRRFSEHPNYIFAIDRKVYFLYEEKIFKNLDSKNLILLEARESAKTLGKADEIYQILAKFEAKRNLTLISIGGGVIQDLTGFVASTLYRGISWIYVPTTLLAQSDSCIGSKTSLNFAKSKNIIGTFYPPTEIYISTSFLKTLEIYDFFSGIGEMIKLELIGTKRQNLPKLIKKINQLKESKDGDLLAKLICECLIIKKAYIEEDEFDLARRNLLNYGHTLGHSLEANSNFKIPHGIAVVIGMIYANLISLKRNLLDYKTFSYLNKDLFLPNIHKDLVKLNPKYFGEELLLSAMLKDKKRTGSDLSFIITNSKLALFRVDNVSVKEAKESLIKLQEILGI